MVVSILNTRSRACAEPAPRDANPGPGSGVDPFLQGSLLFSDSALFLSAKEKEREREPYPLLLSLPELDLDQIMSLQYEWFVK
jgi:hypothetical protein